MKKICFFMETPFTNGGEQRVTTILANYLYEKKYDVSFLLTSSNKYIDYSIYNLNSSINIIFLKHRFKFIEKFFSKIIHIFTYCFRNTYLYKNNLILQKMSYSFHNREICKIINNNNFDYVIGVASDNYAQLSCIKNKIKNTKIIAWQHSCFNSYYNTKNWRFFNQDKFVKNMLKNIDFYICQTQNDKNKLEKKFDFSPIVINNPNTFNTNSISKLNSLNFLAIGRFDEVKQFDKLIKAFKLFSSKNSLWNLYIVGDGPLFNYYKKLIDDYNLQNRVFLPGKTKRVEDYYLNSSIYVMTSKWEGWGMVVTEAMQHGLPVISFDIPSSKEIFGNSNCGILVEKNDIEKLSNAMELLTKNSNLLIDLSKKSIKQVKNFDIDIIGKKWENIFNGR